MGKYDLTIKFGQSLLADTAKYVQACGKRFVTETKQPVFHGINPKLTYAPSGKSFDLPRFFTEEMKETQDALDELSQNSTTEQKNKAFTKLRRFINTFSSVIDKTSKAFELFEKLKKIYNYIAPVIGLMLI